MKPEIWVLEDEEDCRYIYREVLGADYDLRAFETIEEFVKASESGVPKLLIADLLLKGGNFLDYLTHTRGTEKFRFPFLVVSSAAEVDVFRSCYEKGALDVLAKPFNSNQLKVKVEQIVRDAATSWDIKQGNKLSVEGIEFDPDCFELRSNKGKVDLTARETQIIIMLLRATGQPVPRSELVNRIWRGAVVSDKSLDVHLYHLRRKIAPLGLKIDHVEKRGYLISGDGVKWPG